LLSVSLFELNLQYNMNNSYLAHIKLPEEMDAHFYRLIPHQRQVINSLLSERVVLSYSLDMERENVWVFIAAKSEKQVMDILSTFPIIRHVKVTIHELAFHDAAHLTMPDLIMN
jgi:muconolactone delta-isomerase